MLQAGDQLNPEEKLLLYLGSNLQTSQSCFCLCIKKIKVKPLCSSASCRDESLCCDERKTTKGTRSQSSRIWLGEGERHVQQSSLGSALIVEDYKGRTARDTGVNTLSSGLSEQTLAAIMKSSLASAERFLGR